MEINSYNVCRVCGLYYKTFYPWGEDGTAASHDICDCCGIEFGYEDSNLVAIRAARKKWIDSKFAWFKKDKKPAGWDSSKQIANIPKSFL